MESPTMCGLCLPMYRCAMKMQLILDIHSNESTNLISQDQSMNQVNPSIYLFLLVTCLQQSRKDLTVQGWTHTKTLTHTSPWLHSRGDLKHTTTTTTTTTCVLVCVCALVCVRARVCVCVCVCVCVRVYHMHSLRACSERACTRPLQ